VPTRYVRIPSTLAAKRRSQPRAKPTLPFVAGFAGDVLVPATTEPYVTRGHGVPTL